MSIVEPEMQIGLTAAQRADRRLGIGGSDAGAIVAGGEAWRELWAVKTGRRADDDLSDILPVQMGSFTEPFNAYWFTKQTGRAVTMRNQPIAHPTLPYLRANLDGLTTTSSGHPAYIDFKHIGKSGDQMTVRYTAQCTHCAIILSAVLGQPVDWWAISAFIGNAKWELTEQEVDPFFASDYLALCARFWGYVERDEEPPAPQPLSVPSPRKLRTVSLEGEATPLWPNWATEMVQHFTLFAETWDGAQQHDKAKDAIKKLLPDDVGCVTRGRIKVLRVKVLRDKANAVRLSLAKERVNG